MRPAAPLDLTAEQYRALGDRRFGVGADQILVVERSDTPGVDFRYRIYNDSGDEVEQCGNGARCFVRFVRDKGLTDKDAIRVETMNTLLELRLQPDGRVTVDMGAPIFEPRARAVRRQRPARRSAIGGFELWPLDLGDYAVDGQRCCRWATRMRCSSSTDVDHAPVALQGPVIESHPRFPRRVNAGFMQVVSRDHIRLRVYERGAGETLACGTGACAAVVAGIRLGLLDSQGRRRHARRAAHDRMGRRRQPRADDRPGRNRLRRRNRTVIQATAMATGRSDAASHGRSPKHDIANYLANTPSFFERHAELLGSVQLTSPHGQRAVSLQERQMEMLRDKIKGLEHKVMEMIRHGQENVAIADRLHRFTRAIMLTGNAADLPDVRRATR